MAAMEDNTDVLWPSAESHAKVTMNSPKPSSTLPDRTPRHSANRHDDEQPDLSRRFLFVLLRALSAWNT